MKRFGVAMRSILARSSPPLVCSQSPEAAAIYSGAVFNYRTANPTNTFTAGVLDALDHHSAALDRSRRQVPSRA